MSSLDGLVTAYGNCRDLTHAPMQLQLIFYSFKSQFREQDLRFGFPIDKFPSLATQEKDNVRKPYYPISALLSVKWSLTAS